eukprot:COSAG04_NODE_91_length_26852_cov_8.609315_9_plen_133_part_00
MINRLEGPKEEEEPRRKPLPARAPGSSARVVPRGRHSQKQADKQSPNPTQQQPPAGTPRPCRKGFVRTWFMTMSAALFRSATSVNISGAFPTISPRLISCDRVVTGDEACGRDFARVSETERGAMVCAFVGK